MASYTIRIRSAFFLLFFQEHIYSSRMTQGPLRTWLSRQNLKTLKLIVCVIGLRGVLSSNVQEIIYPLKYLESYSLGLFSGYNCYNARLN